MFHLFLKVADVRTDVDKTLSGLKRARGEGERRRLRNELKELRKELRDRERKAMREILQVIMIQLPYW